MKRPPHRKKLPKSRVAAEPTPFTTADKLKVWGIIAGLAAFFVLVFHFSTTAQQRSSLDDLVNRRWRSDYHLSDEQARTLRKMEEDFHGSGDPFFRPAHSAAETTEHHRQMAAVMNPEDGARFFAHMEGKPQKPTPQP